jgi:hypothetical protein
MHPVNRPRIFLVGCIPVVRSRKAVQQIARYDLESLILLCIASFTGHTVNQNALVKILSLHCMAVRLLEVPNLEDAQVVEQRGLHPSASVIQG